MKEPVAAANTPVPDGPDGDDIEVGIDVRPMLDGIAQLSRFDDELALMEGLLDPGSGSGN